MSRLKSAISQIWPRAAIIGAILLLWWIIYTLGVFDRETFPSPAQVWSALDRNVHPILSAAGRSILRLAVGMALAILFGTGIGLAMAASKTVQRSVGSVMVGLQAIPPIAWVVLVVIWLTHPARAIVAIVIIGALPAVAVATAASVRQVPNVLIRAARTLGSSGWELQRNIILPAAFPGYFAGLTQAWTIGWHALLAAELIVLGAFGLGFELSYAGYRGSTSLVMATIFVIVVIGLMVDLVLTIFDRRIRRQRGLLEPA